MGQYSHCAASTFGKPSVDFVLSVIVNALCALFLTYRILGLGHYTIYEHAWPEQDRSSSQYQCNFMVRMLDYSSYPSPRYWRKSTKGILLLDWLRASLPPGPAVVQLLANRNVFSITQHILAPRARTQEQMNMFFLGTPYHLGERYTDLTKVLFVCFFYR